MPQQTVCSCLSAETEEAELCELDKVTFVITFDFLHVSDMTSKTFSGQAISDLFPQPNQNKIDGDH